MSKRDYDNFYKQEGFELKWAGVSDSYDIGGWNSYLKNEDYVFQKEPDYEYSYILDEIIATANKSIIGYCIGHERILNQKQEYANAFDKEYDIYDFAVDCGDASEQVATALLRQAIAYAEHIGCSFLSANFLQGKYNTFYNLCKTAFNAKVYGDKIVIKLDCSKMPVSEKLLIPTATDAISREYALFLKAKKFKYNDKRFWYEAYDSIKISVERTTGEVSFDDQIKNLTGQPIVLNNKKALNLVSYIVRCYTESLLKPEYTAYINKTFYGRNNEFITVDFTFAEDAVIFYDNKGDEKATQIAKSFENLYCLNKNNIRYFDVYTSFFNYDLNYADYEKINSYVPAEIQKYKKNAEIEQLPLKQRKVYFDKHIEMSYKLDEIQVLQFRIGNPFGGIRKIEFSFMGDAVQVRDNAPVKKLGENSCITDKNQIRKLKLKIQSLYLENWKQEYIGESVLDPKPWVLTVRCIGGETFEYRGVNDYPFNFRFLIDIIDEYSNLFNDLNED